MTDHEQELAADRLGAVGFSHRAGDGSENLTDIAYERWNWLRDHPLGDMCLLGHNITGDQEP